MADDIYNPSIITQLDNNKLNHEFINYNNDEKNIIISLGLTMYNSGHRDLLSSNDERMKEIIRNMEENHQNEIKQMNDLLENLKKTNEIHINKRVSDVQKNFSDTIAEYQAQIESLTMTNKNLRESDNWKDFQKILDEYKNDSDIRLQEQKVLYSDLIKTKEIEISEKNTELVKLREQNVETIKINTSSSRKGNKGEIMVEELISQYFPKADIENISKGEGSRGDRIFFIDGIKMMCEVKSYASKVQYNSKERGVQKFIRDMEMNPDYQGGVMISLTSSISDKDKGSIKPMISPEFLDDGRPILFIHPGSFSSIFESNELVFLGIQTLVSIISSLQKNKQIRDILEKSEKFNKIATYVSKLKSCEEQNKSFQIRKTKELLESLENKTQSQLIETIDHLLKTLFNDFDNGCLDENE